jgi:hypothetical protein
MTKMISRTNKIVHTAQIRTEKSKVLNGSLNGTKGEKQSATVMGLILRPIAPHPQ